jgi:type VI protein secretion system component Hcp
MANNGADIYLILLRPTRVPVVGEAVSMAFQGQVLVETLRWNLHNEDETRRAELNEGQYQKIKSLVERKGSVAIRTQHALDTMRRDLLRSEHDRQQALADADEKERDAIHRSHRDKVKGALDAYEDQIKDITHGSDGRYGDEEDERRRQQIDQAERNPNFEITFTKRVDIASTQMLNSMKAGDIFPSGTLTIHKRSATVMDGTSLVFTIQKIRLLDYQLQVVVTDTMTEMMEEWTCEFASLAYVYKNPPSHYSHSNAGQAAAKTLSQGTMRAFTMKNIGSPI